MIGERASKLHFSSLIFDTHSDSLARTVDDGEDLGAETGKGHMDLPRMRAGNQKAQFFASFVDPHRFTPDDAVRRTTSYFDAFDALCAAYPGDIEQARSCQGRAAHNRERHDRRRSCASRAGTRWWTALTSSACSTSAAPAT